MNILIKNSLVIDPANALEKKLDVFVSDGKIVDLKNPGSFPENGAQVVDAAGRIVAPGLIDMHVHLREPGFEHKETIATGTAAAAAGGFTSICCMPNTNPVNDCKVITEYILSRAENASAQVFPIGAITKGSQGEKIADLAELKAVGCVALSDDGRSVMDSALLRKAMERARELDILLISHCEDSSLANAGVMNEGVVSRALGLKGIPPAAEDTIVARDIALAELTGCRLHIAHVSTAGSVRIVRDAKARGVKVTAETCPHYFTLTEEAVREFNTLAKMNPPLRTEDDVREIKQGLQDGTIDVIATDHAPHTMEEKSVSFDKAPFGIIGLETALGLSLRLVDEGVLTLHDVVKKMSQNPASVLDLRKGDLSAGADADITIFDSEQEWTVDTSRFASRSKNSPFNGWKLRGRAMLTMVKGTVHTRNL